MAREGLMDDTGYHGFDEAEELAEKYCFRCKNQPTEIGADGQLYAVECDKDCSLSCPRYFEEEDNECEDCKDCKYTNCIWHEKEDEGAEE